MEFKAKMGTLSLSLQFLQLFDSCSVSKLARNVFDEMRMSVLDNQSGALEIWHGNVLSFD